MTDLVTIAPAIGARVKFINVTGIITGSLARSYLNKVGTIDQIETVAGIKLYAVEFDDGFTAWLGEDNIEDA